jgi:hypothetical protein
MIHIITPCSRPDNLKTVSKSIPETCKWTVSMDSNVTCDVTLENATVIRGPFTGNYGNEVKNYALDTGKFNDEDWIYFLDDDNIIHPQWWPTVSKLLKLDRGMMVWGQKFKEGKTRLRATSNPAIGNIDLASYMCKWSALKNFRFDKTLYEADGLLAMQVHKKFGSVIVPGYLCYYNFLK